MHDKLHIAPFDIIDIEGEPCEVTHYKEKWTKLHRWFNAGTLVRQVDATAATGRNEVEKIYTEWVIEGGAEGLVVHSEQPIIYKVKPRHTIDAVVIGYTVGEDAHAEMMRDMLLAVMRPDGILQQFASTGTGLTEDTFNNSFWEIRGSFRLFPVKSDSCKHTLDSHIWFLIYTSIFDFHIFKMT